MTDAAPRRVQALLVQAQSAARDVAANTARLVRDIESHPETDLVVFPELFLTGYTLRGVGSLALDVAAEEFTRIREAAQQSATAVVVGFIEADGRRTYNSIAAIDASGRLAGVYRKVNLFGDEATTFDRGSPIDPIDLDGVRVGLLNCFDVEFPEPARALALAGADLFVTPAANMAPFYDDHELASRARALDNRRPHLYVNAVGDADGLDLVGGSRAIDANGAVIAQAASGERELTATVTVRAPLDPAVDYIRNLKQALARS